MNLALYYRSNESYSEALQMFWQLRKIQEHMFGPIGEALVYTIKNIGICYLALGDSQKAEENYLVALDIIEKLKTSRKPSSKTQQLEKEDYEQLAAIYFNLYLTSMQKQDKQKSKDYNLKCLEYYTLARGNDKNLSCSNCYFI